MYVPLKALTPLYLIHAAVGAAFSDSNGELPRKLFRREDYIDGTGYNTQNTPAINIPLNNNASSEQEWMDPTDVYLNVLIPHTSLVATAFSSGGGSKQSINGGGLAGRASGGGTRNEIYGTARYGSGYGQYTTSADGTTQYQPDFTLDVSRRDFPHGFPPLSFGNYSGGGEYYSVEQGDLPGVLAPHHCATATIGSCDARVFALDISVGDQTWYALADYVTVETINAIVSLPVAQGGCNMIGRIPQAMARGSTYGSQNETAPIGDKETQGYSTARATGLGIIRLDLYPWNVLQFYRGSSVAFISPDYDNAFAHNGNNNTDYWASTPFNKTGGHTLFGLPQSHYRSRHPHREPNINRPQSFVKRPDCWHRRWVCCWSGPDCGRDMVLAQQTEKDQTGVLKRIMIFADKFMYNCVCRLYA